VSISTVVDINAPLASVIIPNWNGIELLRACLGSLRHQTIDSFEVIVVDNHSTDDSVAVLHHEFPEVTVLALPKNVGFTGGCNAGLLAAHGRYLVLLNNDTEVEPEWLEKLTRGLSLHPEAGIATSRIMLYNPRGVLNAAGDIYRRNGVPDSRGVWQAYGPDYATEAWVFGGSGGAMALRREMLAETGLFDESFFMWCEDVDLSWRCQLLGWKCIYIPDAVIYHHLSATGGGPLASYYVGRNTLWVIARNMPPALYERHRQEIWKAQRDIFYSALRSWRGKAARARLRGQAAGILTFHRWREYNQKLMQKRRVDDAYLESILS